MTRDYRGCKIDVHRDQALGGWFEVYWSAFAPDGYEIAAGFGGGTVLEMYDCMKTHVDRFIDDFGSDSERHSADREL